MCKRHTVGKVAVSSGMYGGAESELHLLVAGEVDGVGWTRPHRQHIHAPDRSPQPLGPDDLPQGVHHVAVACSRLRVQTLHACLWRDEQMMSTSGISKGKREKVKVVS